MWPAWLAPILGRYSQAEPDRPGQQQEMRVVLCPELSGRFWVSRGQREPAVCVRRPGGWGRGRPPAGRLNNSDSLGKKGWGRGQPSGVRAAPAIGHLPCCRSQAFATAPGWCPKSPPGPAECWPASAQVSLSLSLQPWTLSPRAPLPSTRGGPALQSPHSSHSLRPQEDQRGAWGPATTCRASLFSPDETESQAAEVGGWPARALSHTVSIGRLQAKGRQQPGPGPCRALLGRRACGLFLLSDDTTQAAAVTYLCRPRARPQRQLCTLGSTPSPQGSPFPHPGSPGA